MHDVLIDVPNDFHAPQDSAGQHRSNPPKDVWHVDTSGRPQFTVIKERVIEINDSRRVYHDFLNRVIPDMVLIAFLGHAEKLFDSILTNMCLGSAVA